MTLQIEITKRYNDRWNIRIGDIEGCTECSNMTEEDLIEEIKEQLKIENDLNSTKENRENFDDGLTRVAKKGEFKA